MPIYLALSPNWAQPVRESLGYSTDTYLTASGNEAREALRIHPDWSFKFEAMIDRAAHRRLVWLTVAQREKVLLWAAPTIYARTSAAVATSADFIPITDPPEWLAVGALVEVGGAPQIITSRVWNGISVSPYLVDDLGDPVSVEILRTEAGMSILTEGDLTLEVSVSRQPILAGGFVRLILRGRLGPLQTIRFETARLGVATIEFFVAADQFAPYPQIAPALAIPTFYSLPLLDFAVNWRESMEISYDTQRSVVGIPSGPETFFWEPTATVRRWTYTHSTSANSMVQRLLYFFCTQRGRAQSFYFPGDASEIEVALDLPAGGVDLTLVGLDHSVAQDLAASPQHIMIRAAGGVYLRRVETAYATEDGQTVLVLYDPLPVALVVATVTSVRVLHQCRFSDDSLEVVWFTPTVADIQLKLRSLDYQFPDPTVLTSEGDAAILSESDLEILVV